MKFKPQRRNLPGVSFGTFACTDALQFPCCEKDSQVIWLENMTMRMRIAPRMTKDITVQLRVPTNIWSDRFVC